MTIRLSLNYYNSNNAEYSFIGSALGSQAYSINGAGVIVGVDTDSGSNTIFPFILIGGTEYNLSDLINSNSYDFNFGYLVINNHNQIAAIAFQYQPLFLGLVLLAPQ